MTLIPLLGRTTGKGADQRIVLRPLFALEPGFAHARLERAKDGLAALLAKQDPAPLIAPGPLEEMSLEIRCDLRDRTERGRMLAVWWWVGGTRVAMLAGWPQWFFVLPPGDAATAVGGLLAARLRAEDAPAFASLVVGREAWIDGLEVSAKRRVRARPRFALLHESRPLTGAEELAKVGVDLDAAPATPCLMRETEMERLRGLLTQRRAVVVTGAPGVGKTALINGLVRGWRRGDGQAMHRTWLIPPAALIAGMSVIGAWEQRLDAILRHLEEHGHILVIDDLPGWQRTGISSANHLDAARMLRPWLERGRLRVLVEADDDVLAAVRERDRALADLLEPLRLDPLPPAAARRVLVGLARHLEDQGARPADAQLLTGVIDAHRRHLPHLAAPGGPALLLNAMLSEGPGADPLAGLGLAADCGINRPGRACEMLRARLLDQPEALAALTDAIAILAAAVSDPERPVLSLFFSGPSGVGKTEAAKALAEAAFGATAGDSTALIRVDCNELIAPGAAVRLTGDFAQPDGLLTGPVRRRPFAVILLDEIEKAHVEVHHLLLQLLGEGRLGDGEGRSVRFDRCIVIMTANIMPAGRLGFAPGSAGDLLAALPEHFPPELINRIDRTVAFRALGEEALRELARRACQRVCAREGLQRRGILVELDEALVATLARGPFDPALGARELHRAVESLLAAPLAELAAARSPGRHPTVVRLAPGRPLRVACVDLAPAPGARDDGDPRDPAPRLAAVAALLAETAAVEAERVRQRALADGAGVAIRELAWAYNLGDELAVIRRRLHGEAERLAEAGTAGAPLDALRGALRWQGLRDISGRSSWPGGVWESYCATENVLDWLRSLPANAVAEDAVDLGALAGRLFLARETLAGADPAAAMAAQVALVIARGAAGAAAWSGVAAACWRTLQGLRGLAALDVQGEDPAERDIAPDGAPAVIALGLAGAGARRVAEALAGTWLVHDRSGSLHFVLVGVRDLQPGAPLAAAATTAPLPLGPIRRIVAPDGSTIDPATGWVGRNNDEAAAWGRALLRQIAFNHTANAPVQP